MLEIKRERLGTFYIYTPEEAKELGIEWRDDWWEATEGQWVKTTDGYIAQCLKRQFFKNRSKNCIYYRLKFAFGFVWVRYRGDEFTFNNELNAMAYIKARAFNRNAPITYGAYIVKSRIFKHFFPIYARLIVENKLNEEVFERLANRFCRRHTKPVLRLKVILRQKEVKERVEQEVINRMLQIGIEDPKNYAIKLLKKAAEIAEKDRNADAMIKVAKEFNALTDAYPKKLTVTEQLEMISTKRILGSIEEEEKKLIASKREDED